MSGASVTREGVIGEGAETPPVTAPLPGRLKLSYGLAEFGKAFFIHAPNLVWLFFLTEVVGLRPELAGVLILIPLLWDAVTDPLFGYLADRTRTRFGQYRPYLIFGVPVVAVLFTLFFTDPKLLGLPVVATVLVTAIMFRTGLTVVDVPHNAMLAKATRSSRDRASLAGVKMLFNAGAMVAIALATRPILAGDGAGEEARAFVFFAGLGGLIAVLLMWQNAYVFRRIDAPLPPGAARPRAASPREQLGTLRTNRYLWIVMACAVVAMMLLPAFAKVLLYYAKYVLGREEAGGAALLAFTLCTLVSIPVWARVAKRADKARALQAAHGVVAASLVLFFVAPVAGAGPLLALAAVVGLGMGGVNMLTMALIPDVVEYGQWRSGKRAEAGVFGCFTFALKAGNGLGVGLLGVMLGLIGFVPNAAQDEATLRGIETLMTLIPAAGSLFVVVVLSRFDLGHAQHGALVRAIERGERRAAGERLPRAVPEAP